MMNTKCYTSSSISDAPPICFHQYNDTFGNFSTPGYPDVHPHDHFCRWEFEAPPDKFIRVTIGATHINHHQHRSKSIQNCTEDTGVQFTNMRKS